MSVLRRSRSRILLALILSLALGLFWSGRLLLAQEAAPDWVIFGEATDSLGEDVAGIGDVNGDGYADLAVIGGDHVLLYLGGPDGPGINPDQNLSELGGGFFFPRKLAAAGDVNSDGYADLAAAAPFFEESIGQVRVYYGGPDGFTAFWSITGHAPDSQLGASLDAAGDVNGDGYADLIVGAPGAFGSDLAGQAAIYYGSPDGMQDEPDLVIAAADDVSRLGATVAGAGDVDGDGYADVLISVPSVDEVHLYYGSTEGIELEPGLVLVAEEFDFLFGDYVAGLGDVDGDGLDDFAIDAANVDDSYKVYIYTGSPDGPAETPTTRLVMPDADRLDGAMHAAGDVNGDGYADVAMGLAPPNYEESGFGLLHIFTGGPDGVSTAPTALIAADAVADGFGLVADAAGDVNGDGYGDLVVGMPDSDEAADFAGKAAIYLGGETAAGDVRAAASAGALTLEPHWQLEGSRGTFLGYQAVGVGDVNADGFPDVVLSELLARDNNGDAFLYLGTPTGLSDAPAWVSNEETPTGLFGGQVVAPGDVNGDGYADVLISAPLYVAPEFEPGAGKVFLYFGTDQGLTAEPAWTVAGELEDDGVGRLIAAAGDVNGDGYADIAAVVSKTLADEDGFDRQVLIYHGGPEGPSLEPDFATALEDDFGFAVAPLGDVNADGFGDLMITPYAFPDYEGAVLVYYGSADGLSLEPDFVDSGDQGGDNLGFSIAGVGDVNGDGYDDALVGVPGADDGLGQARLYFGAEEGLAAGSFATLRGEAAGRRFGDVVAPVGDVNGDGFADLAVAEEFNPDGDSAVFIYLGSEDGPILRPAATLNLELRETYAWGMRIGPAGDINGDGNDDIITAEPGFASNSGDGRVTVFAGASTAGGDMRALSWAPADQQVLTPEDPTNLLGYPAVVVGDVNGDGFADLLAVTYPGPEEEPEALVQLYFGSQAGVPDAPSWTVTTADWGAQAGLDEPLLPQVAAGVGDVNGDGYDDFAVAGFDSEFTTSVVQLFLGAQGEPGAQPDWSLVAQADMLTGLRVAGIGDVNQDGYDELAVLSANINDPAVPAVLAVFYGTTDGPGAEPDWTYETTDIMDGFLAVTGIGDVDDDGYPDLLLGLPGFPEDERMGKLVMIQGGPDGLNDESIWEMEGETVDAGLGFAVAGVGDMNGDGYSDFAYSTPGLNDETGQVTVALTAPSGPQETIWLVLDGLNDGDVFGLHLAGAGDVNGDGYDDLLAYSLGETDGAGAWWLYLGGQDLGAMPEQAPAPAYVFSDRDGGDFAIFTGTQTGDLNGDGYTDLALGRADFDAWGEGMPDSGDITVYYGGPGGGPVVVQADAPSPLESLRQNGVQPGDAGVRPGDDGPGAAGDDGDDGAPPVPEATPTPVPTLTPTVLPTATPTEAGGFVTPTPARLELPTRESTSTPTSPPPTSTPLPPTATPAPAEPSIPLVEITANTLNVRSGPGTNYPRVATVDQGDVFAVIGQAYDCGWLLIEDTSGATGWISGSTQYVAFDSPCSTIPPAEIPPVPADGGAGTGSGGSGSSGGSGAASGQACLLFINNVGPELTVTLTRRSDNWNDTFTVPSNGRLEYCFDPGSYTYTIDAPPPWNSINGEFSINAGEYYEFPVGRAE